MTPRQLRFTRSFVREYQQLPTTIQAQVDEALRQLAHDPRHPSLRVKKMQPMSRGIFEARVTRGYRMTFAVEGAAFMLRRVGTHDILRTP